MPNRVFGEIPGVPVGTVFASRRELSRAGVHRPLQAGISGAENEGADSIVLSGGYEDDNDFGNVIIYTGHGGQDPVSHRHVADQELTRQNKALVVSMNERLPIRVIRGATHSSPFAPPQGYRYDGLFIVERHWHDQGAAGFRVWRFRMILQSESSPSTRYSGELTISSGNATPGRFHRAVNQIARDTLLRGQVKALYDFHCQVCATRLVGPGKLPYAEAAHVRPLGRPHNGPDTMDNLLCLCPNHHYLFDVGAFGIRDDLSLIGLKGRLQLHRRHKLSLEHLRYHRQHFGLLARR